MRTGVTLAAYAHTRCRYDKSGLIFRDVVFSSTLPSLLSYRGNTGQGRARDLVKNLWSKNQIDNKKEGELITRRESNGSAMPKLDGSRGR